MRCHHCQAPRLPDAKACPYCAATFTTAHPPATQPGLAPQASTAAWDLAFVQMRRQPRTAALLAERAGLPEPPRPSVLRQALPLLLMGGFAAYLVLSGRSEDGALDPRSLWIGGAFAALGAAATVASAMRARRIAATPVEGLLARIGVRDVTIEEPGIGAEKRAHRGRGKPRYVLALEDGAQRYVWPLSDARGRDALVRGARGVAWVKGPYLIGFQPVE